MRRYGYNLARVMHVGGIIAGIIRLDQMTAPAYQRRRQSVTYPMETGNAR